MPVAAEYNDVDTRLLRKAVDSGLDVYLCDANEVIEFKLVREAKDVDDDETTFNPEMSHQVYGENESIFGYKDLRIKVYIKKNPLILRKLTIFPFFNVFSKKWFNKLNVAESLANIDNRLRLVNGNALFLACYQLLRMIHEVLN